MEELELSWKKFIEGVSHFDNMVNSDIPLPFIPLSVAPYLLFLLLPCT